MSSYTMVSVLAQAPTIVDRALCNDDRQSVSQRSATRLSGSTIAPLLPKSAERPVDYPRESPDGPGPGLTTRQRLIMLQDRRHWCSMPANNLQKHCKVILPVDLEAAVTTIT